MNIGVIGAGYVGLVTGTCFSHLGHKVWCVDNNREKLALLNKGKTPIYEPGLEEMVQASLKKKKLLFTHQIKAAVKNCDIIFICVNTPPKDNGEADLSFVENVAREIGRNLISYRLIVDKSTVPVQTGERVQQTIAAVQPKKTLFDVASNPEFLREGSAIHDFMNPDRVVVGVSSKKAEKLLRDLYRPFLSKLVVTDIKSAEIIKHACNSFLAAKITFINTVSRICEAAGADVEEVARGMGLDPRIGPRFLQAGIGFGGSCFPKDLAAFIRISEKLGVSFGMLREVVAENEAQKAHFIQKIENTLWNLNNKLIGVLGIAFKPETDDIRSAPSLTIIEALQNEGVKIQAYDPQAMAKARGVLKNVRFSRNPYDAAAKADALLILTEWDEFKGLDFKKVKRSMKQPVIFDGRNLLDPKVMKKLGFQYYGIGRKS